MLLRRSLVRDANDWQSVVLKATIRKNFECSLYKIKKTITRDKQIGKKVEMVRELSVFDQF